jgi:hypothetical protein
MTLKGRQKGKMNNENKGEDKSNMICVVTFSCRLYETCISTLLLYADLD